MMESCTCCEADLSQGEEKKRRRILSKSGYQNVLISLIAELDVELDVEKLNYLCRKCAEKLKKLKEKKEELLSLLRRSDSLETLLASSSGACAGTSQVQHSASGSPEVTVSCCCFFNYL